MVTGTRLIVSSQVHCLSPSKYFRPDRRWVVPRLLLKRVRNNRDLKLASHLHLVPKLGCGELFFHFYVHLHVIYNFQLYLFFFFLLLSYRQTLVLYLRLQQNQILSNLLLGIFTNLSLRATKASLNNH